MKTREIFDNYEGNLIHKWNHYFEIYDTHFERFVGRDIVILEIGVSQGGSIQLWKSFFGSKLKYYGIDINPKCKIFEEDNVSIFIGSQEDPEFLLSLKSKIPDLDILIDDGGHTMKQQITAFEILFDKIKNNGLYLCEDNHTSYWFDFGGGMKRKGTYMEYIKNLIDVMHLWYAGKNTFISNYNMKEKIYAIHIYDSIVVIEKKSITQPYDVKKGQYNVGYLDDKRKEPTYKVRFLFYQFTNRLRSMFYK